MITIQINNEYLDLPSGLTMEIEDSNPIFHDFAAYSLPVTLPDTPKNNRLLSFPRALDNCRRPNSQLIPATVTAGAIQMQGTLNLLSVDADGFSVSIGFNSSTMYQKWRDKKLCELQNLPVIKGTVNQLKAMMLTEYKKPNQSQPFAVFPIVVKRDGEFVETLNHTESGGWYVQDNIVRKVNNTETKVLVPNGYGISPFVKVWAIIDAIFADLGAVLENNPFKLDGDLASLVVLNNTTDALCTGMVKLSELMPDVTISQFLNALWVRFGLVGTYNPQTNTAKLEFVKDIITAQPYHNLGSFAASPLLPEFSAPQYIKLSAKTSLEGAEPQMNTWALFMETLGDIRNLTGGDSVHTWTAPGNTSVGASTLESQWPRDNDYELYDGSDISDVPDTDPYDPTEEVDPDDYVEPTIPDDRLPPDEYQSTVSASPKKTHFAVDFKTGALYSVDSDNGRTTLFSSRFFQWDPKPSGHDVFELSSDDEFVPIPEGYACKIVHNQQSYLSGMPHFSAGARQRHTSIIGDQANGKQETPLAFMLALKDASRTYGRNTPEFSSGTRLNNLWSKPATLSLLFDFSDGLYARFWKEFDMVLRSGRTGNGVFNIPPKTINEMNLAGICRPVAIGSGKLMIDQLRYNIGADGFAKTEGKFRSLLCRHLSDEELGIPPIPSQTVKLWWKPVSTNLEAATWASGAALRKTVQRFTARTGIGSRGTATDFHEVVAIPYPKYFRDVISWQEAANKEPAPTGQDTRTFPATAYVFCEIEEVHYQTINGVKTEVERKTLAWSEDYVEVKYDVKVTSGYVLNLTRPLS